MSRWRVLMHPKRVAGADMVVAGDGHDTNRRLVGPEGSRARGAAELRSRFGASTRGSAGDRTRL